MTSSWPCLQDWVKEVQGGVRDSKNELDEQGPDTAVRCPDLSHIVGLVGEEAAVPVSTCDRRFFNSQECGEERLGDFMEYWRNRQVGVRHCRWT